MTKLNDSERESAGRISFERYPLITVFISLSAIVATFLLATSELDVTTKMIGFGGIIAAYLTGSGLSYFFQSKRITIQKPGPSEIEIERGLDALDEASAFFSGSLKSADAFRLVSSRVRDLVPFHTIVLFLLNESRERLTAVHADGSAADGQKGTILNFYEGLAGQAYTTKQVEIDSYLMLDSEQEFGSSVAIPLRHAENVFGVMQLYFDKEFDVLGAEDSLFEAVGTRAAPLILGSIAFERSQANALTDVTTDLPNERAFYLVLENQVAEAQRKQDDRPLTVLAIDIRNFDEINRKFGHAAGDNVLNFVAQVIKDNLRQMDFVARALNDEFLAILPTATKEISHDIIARVHTGFFGRKFKLTDSEAIEIEVNIGWAAFGSDGETPGQLLSLAQLRKEQSKSTGPQKILLFPQEAAH